MLSSRLPLALLCLFVGSLTSGSELKLSSVFGDGMVLQRDQPIKVWGRALPGSPIRVTFADQSGESTADVEGRWSLHLEPCEASSEEREMEVSAGNDSITFSDVLVGDVWLCSGMSSMAILLSDAFDSDLELTSADYPQIRLLSIPPNSGPEPQETFNGSWQSCDAGTAANFSGIGYFFGKQLHQTLDIPIGLINQSVARGTTESWIERETFNDDPNLTQFQDYWQERDSKTDYESLLKEWLKEKIEAENRGEKTTRRPPQNPLTSSLRPGNLFSGSLGPILGFGLRGVIWSHGLSGLSHPESYRELFPVLVESWRSSTGYEDLPFFWMQSPGFPGTTALSETSRLAFLRESQSSALNLPFTGQVVSYDVFNPLRMSITNSRSVAERFARLALEQVNGLDLISVSPSLDRQEINGNYLDLTFKNVATRLEQLPRSAISGFAIAGEDRVWYPATVKIVDRSKIKVWSFQVKAPVAVRYSWSDQPQGNLRTRDGFPVAPFRTDNWPMQADPPEDPNSPANN